MTERQLGACALTNDCEMGIFVYVYDDATKFSRITAKKT